eukprot:1147806-Pelagomonas_calceolata.AAC.5
MKEDTRFLLHRHTKGISNALRNMSCINLDGTHNLPIPHRHALRSKTCNPLQIFPLALGVLSQDVIIWIALFTFSQVAIVLSFVIYRC